MYQVLYRKTAAKALLKMPLRVAEQFKKAFEQMAIDHEDGLDIKKLEGREGFRLRIGGYRAIYRKLHDVLIIEVLKVGSRGDIYK
ncbi:type II toxin-antitoxin system RelE family toxin [Methylomonas fluvii]|uniref:Type II toxin-antitoxin system RelE/ParE family toxin n=1 Tax=Methylomonas fluvii TaxID=1854564 RepID=A0ABR9D8V8_9GAMM|nr:type II toxin-antitoxin system RelE/ParE family toxin [Methylomonas fluvii]MBD9359547.1 type II toxin-antitoxin system RelE/ParE family toxin [Methylomonas fluvii]